MKKTLRRCFSLFKTGLIEVLQFRASLLVILFGNLIYLVVIYNLWKAIYASVDTPVVNGMSFTDTMIYLVLASAIFGVMEAYLVWDMGRSIQSGEIVLDILKPISYEQYKFFPHIGGAFATFLITFIPTFVIVELITGGAIRFGVNIAYFLLSMLLGTAINFTIDFFVGTICLYSQSIWGINIMKEVIVFFFSGVTVPLAFFPEKLRMVADMLPFQAIYNTPLTILTNNTLSGTDILKMLGYQVLWLAAMLVISKLFWNRSLRAVTVNGG